MEIIVCVPGTEGSRLSLHGEEVWPPTLEELITNYDRLQKIMDPAVVVTEIVKNVECFPIYQPLIDDLAEIAQKSGARG
jgi:phospholipase A1